MLWQKLGQNYHGVLGRIEDTIISFWNFLTFTVIIFLTINASINVVVYGAFSQKFREMFLNHFYPDCGCCNQNPTASSFQSQITLTTLPWIVTNFKCYPSFSTCLNLLYMYQKYQIKMLLANFLSFVKKLLYIREVPKQF